MNHDSLLPAIFENLPASACDVASIGVDLATLQQAIGYRFARPQLLRVAVTHPTWVAEADDTTWPSQACLEFLGDAVVDLQVADAVWRRFPNLHEGDLTRLRASLVSEPALARVARAIGLGHWLLLGKSAANSNLADQDVVLADAVEAIIGAAFLDARARGSESLSALQVMFDRLFGSQIAALSPDDGHDPKSLL